MSQNFSYLYELMCNFFYTTSHSKVFGKTKLGFARFLGMSQGKTQNWERGQWPKAEDLRILHKKLGFSYEWLVTGEGEMLVADQLATPARREGKPSSVVESAQPANDGLNQRVAELEREIAELNVELRSAFKEVRQLNEEKRELEDRLKASPVFLENEGNPEAATSPRPVIGAPESGMLGDFSKN